MLNDKSEYPIYEEQCQEWAGLYPAVDVIQQLRAMNGWLNANPKKRKTKSGILRFVNGWLAREQDRGRRETGPPSQHGHALPVRETSQHRYTQRQYTPEDLEALIYDPYKQAEIDSS